ncbi:Cytochrome c oxidase polypeptide III [Acidisarcina polymorpha]|uniref:Cytochrome c oxidase polypeptide III n=1 Tax=Acidisarcina polymorpha TaxID=2211140 RepID=A0A2Z5G8K9_9BACT|nr:cytochrome c oxidase subunit 3 [Acidisarcina polymorpha]AXC15034.1 Cytochrome c oxidase polypeptide III [Acidisarcina polymorpha]
MSTIPVTREVSEAPWTLPSRGIVGMACLILAESAIFIIFVVAYVYYIGKSLSGPTPKQVLELPIVATICLLSSSITAHAAVSSLRKDRVSACTAWLGATIFLALVFLFYTAKEWYELIYHYGLTIRTNLFGTTFYSLVGLHATHVVVGLIMLTVALIAGLRKAMNEHHAEKLEVLSLYWHFVDAVWVVVFTVVYVLGR